MKLLQYAFPILSAIFPFAFGNVLLADTEDSKYVQRLQAEKGKLNAQLAATPYDDESNLLYAGVLFLDLAEAAEFKNLLISAGVSNSILSATLNDLDDEYGFTLDTTFNASNLFSYYGNTLIPQMKLIDSHLARISATAVIKMSKEQTGSDDEAYVDYTDVQVIRAMFKALTAFFQMDHAYGFSLDAAKVKPLDDSGLLSVESIFDLNTELGAVSSPASLSDAKSSLKEAISLYKAASPQLRNTTRGGLDRLFYLEWDDLEDEELFLSDLEELSTALDGASNFSIDNNSKNDLNLKQFFAGKLNFSTMLPGLAGNKFESATVSDPTFGGVLPYWTSGMVEEKLTDADMLAKDLWSGTKSLGSRWWQSHWLGSFYNTGSRNWIYHSAFGWLYQATETPSSIWLWHSDLGWLWTTSRTFPYLYKYGNGSNSTWLYCLVQWNVVLEKGPHGWFLRKLK